jgi:hypothetical protein
MLAAALLVYGLAHRRGILSPYAINDDVRQQVYWMEQWRDRDLYRDHLPTAYARHYVPWGVQAVYRAAAPWISPVQFSKLLGAILFTATSGLLFLLAAALVDELAGVLTVCVSFQFAFFLGAISGGLSRGFVPPLMLLHLLLLARGDALRGGVVVMVQPLFNPYLFLTCLTTHGLFLLQGLLPQPPWRPAPRSAPAARLRHLSRLLLPPAAGLLLLLVQHRLLQNPLFGTLVSKAGMIGQPEYGAAGRYEILPQPSVFFELLRPLVQDPPGGLRGITAAAVGLALVAACMASGWNGPRLRRHLARLAPLACLPAAALALYGLARLMLLDLFLPSRYLEYPLAILYCLAVGLGLRAAAAAEGVKKRLKLLIPILVLLGALRLEGVALTDYGALAPLYRFFHATPAGCTVAGHPELMDSLMTFGRRKAFVSYELSHPWAVDYWRIIKGWTEELFEAYYAERPEALRNFCRKHGIAYFVVREEDFAVAPARAVYFEPFGARIAAWKRERSTFAALDATVFRPVFRHRGIRVLTPLE